MWINFDQQDREWALEQAVAKERKKIALEQEKITQERDKAIQEYDQERQASITRLIKVFASDGNDKPAIIDALMKVFNLSAAQAEKYYQQTLNPA